MSNIVKKQYISDLIGDDYKSWQPGDTVLLRAGTGTGKSTFCIRTLGTWALQNQKKVLYVCNRTKLEDNVKLNLEAFIQTNSAVDITKYQNLESGFDYLKNRFNKYDYIFFDECHYFLSDSTMNIYTDVIYNGAIANTNSVIIFASATAEELFSDIIEKRRVGLRNIYTLETDYSFVDKVLMYQKDNLCEIISTLLRRDSAAKIVVFCNNGNRIMEIYRAFGEETVAVCCSDNYIDKRVMEVRTKNAITNNMFEKRILIATAVVDNGIDLKDPLIKHIFTEMVTIDSIVQTLGRKRPVAEDDTCTYYIRNRNIKELNGYLTAAKTQLSPLEMKNDATLNAFGYFDEEYGNDRTVMKTNKIIYSLLDGSGTKVNELALKKFIMDRDLYDEMIKEGFANVVASKLPPQLGAKVLKINMQNYKDWFLEALKNLEGKAFYKDVFDTKIKKLFKTEMERYGKKCKTLGMKSMNNYLDETYGDSYKLRFVSKKDNRKTVNGKTNTKRGCHYYMLE